VPRKHQHIPGADETLCSPTPSSKGAKAKPLPKLHGDIKGLELAFVETRRRLIGTTVPESVLFQMQKHPGSISGFYEDAVARFDGDLPALVEAAVQFVKQRKLRAGSDPIRTANGRVYLTTLQRIQEIERALETVRGMSRAKVLAGLIQLYSLNTPVE
jgi:hypothetical protein